MANKKSVVYGVGDRVTWSSQAGGYSKTKIGTVVEVKRPDDPNQDIDQIKFDLIVKGRKP